MEPNVRRLGANAAACWYHYHQEECSREEFVREAMDFAYGDYARALLLGKRMELSEREKVLERLSYYTGISMDFLRKGNLRFGEIDFVLQLCPGKVVSIYDSRLLHQPEQGQSYSENIMTDADIVEPDMAQDAFMSSVGPAVEAAFEEYCGRELCLRLEGKSWILCWKSRNNGITEDMKRYVVSSGRTDEEKTAFTYDVCKRIL